MNSDNYQNEGLDFDENGTTVLTEEDINFARGTVPNQQQPQPQQPPQLQNDPFINPEYMDSNASAQTNVNENINDAYANPQMQQQNHQHNYHPQQQAPQLQKAKKLKLPKNQYGKIRKKWLLPVIIAAAVVVVGLGVFFGAYYIPNNIKYNKAVTEFKDENYSDAIDIFTKIEGFKDSKEKIYLCYTMSGDELDQQQKYNLAKQQYEKSLKYSQNNEQKKKSKEKIKTLGHKEMFKTAYDACRGLKYATLSIDGLQIDVSIDTDALEESVNCLGIVMDNLKIAENDDGNVLEEALNSLKQGQEYSKQVGDITVKATNSSISGTTFTFTAE